MTVAEFRAAFTGALRVRGPRRRRVLAEVEDHLADAVEAELAAAGPAGDPQAAEARAVARFGDPRQIARDLGGGLPPLRAIALRALPVWLPAVLVTSAVALLVFAAGQHELRSSANDPQLQVAEDAAARLSSGAQPAELTTGPQVDLARSLALHLTVYDANGRVLASTATLNGVTPTPPLGVLAAGRRNGRNVLTWQPRPGVRAAAVVLPYEGPHGAGTVLAGRSLRAVEDREQTLLLVVLVGWLGTVLAGTAAALGTAGWAMTMRERAALELTG